MNDLHLLKYLAGEQDAAEKLLLEQWIASDKANERHFHQLLSAWEMSLLARNQDYRDPEAAWQRFISLRTLAETTSKSRYKAEVMYWVRIAAVFLFCVSVAVLLYVSHDLTLDAFADRDIAASNVVMKDTLPDGTEVTLNKQSAIHYEQSRKKRTVRFGKGEVFFRVARNENKPFEVLAGKLKVKVLGTAFNMRKEGSRIELIVSSGRVQVELEGKMVNLMANQRVLADLSAHRIETGMVKDLLYQYYVDNRLVLKNTPLRDVVNVLAEVYDREIIIEDPKAGALTITATFDHGNLDEMMQVITETLDRKLVKKGKTIIVK